MKNKTFYLKITLTIVLIVYLINSIGLSNIYETIIRGNFTFFLVSCSFMPIFIIIKTLKWHLIVSHAGAKEGFFTSLHAILVGLGFGIFTPVRAGEILRIRYYSSVEKVMLGSLVVVDRLIDLITVLFLSIYFVVDQFGLLYSAIVFLIIGSLLLLLLVLGRLIKIYKLIPVKKESGKLSQFFNKVGTCSKVLTPINITMFGGISFLNWLVVMIQFYFIMNMYHILKFRVVIASLPIIQLSNLIPITIAGIGVRENLSVFIMKVYNIPDQVAAISAFTLYMIDILIPGIAGLILFTSKQNI